jgi:hypothetical protein
VTGPDDGAQDAAAVVPPPEESSPDEQPPASNSIDMTAAPAARVRIRMVCPFIDRRWVVRVGLT